MGNQKDRQYNGHRKIPDGPEWVIRRTDNTMATERYQMAGYPEGQTMQWPQKDTRWPGNQMDRQYNDHRKIPDGPEWVIRRTDNTMATERYQMAR